MESSRARRPPRMALQHPSRPAGHALTSAPSISRPRSSTDRASALRCLLEQVAGGTQVRANIEVSLRGPAKLFGGMFERWYGKSWARGLANLKGMMEAGEL
jgi:hypothetical protein